MFDKLTQRSFLSPAVAFTFIAVALTGILLLFHIHFPGIKDIHDWVGLAFVIFGVFHLAINWKPFEKHLRNRDARIALVLVAVLTISCGILGVNNSDNGHWKRGHRQSSIAKMGN